MADEFEFHAGGSNWPPGMDRTLYGREGYLEAHRQMTELLNVRSIEVDDLLILGDRRVGALLRFVIGAGDGTIDQHVLDVYEFREDGALVRQTVYFDVEEGRRALGL